MTNLQGLAFSTKAIPSLRYVLESLVVKQAQETLTLVCELQYAQFFQNGILNVEAAHFTFPFVSFFVDSIMFHLYRDCNLVLLCRFSAIIERDSQALSRSNKDLQLDLSLLLMGTRTHSICTIGVKSKIQC